MATTGGLALTTAMGVVNRVHCNTTGLRAHALPAVTSGLADLHLVMFCISDHADRCPAVDRNTAHLGGRQTQGCEVALLGHELHTHPCRAGHLGATTRLEFDGVHDRADGDVAEGEGIAHADLGSLTGLDRVADR